MKKRRYTKSTPESRLAMLKHQLERLLDATRVRELRIANLRDKIAKAEETPQVPVETPVTADEPVSG